VQAASYLGNRQLAVGESERTPPGPNDVEIDVAYTGICGTDLHILHGAMDSRVTLPAVLGHEMSGTIRTVGDNVREWAAGERVTVMPLSWCGNCPACSAGANHICHHLNFLGIDSPGSMQTSWTVPENVLVRVPDALALEVAALAEPTAVAVHDVRRSQLADGEHALVVGGGPIGLLIAAVARAGGGNVLLVEPNPLRRNMAASLGYQVCDPANETLQAVVADWTEGAGAPVAFEVSGSVAGLDSAIQSLGVHGRLVVVAIHADAPPVDLFRVFWRELTLIGARVYERQDFERAVELLAEDAIPSAQLITDVEPLDRVAAGFAALESGSALKVLLDCRGEL
jgi:(R,R)-butanediol dehydrogenase / meso-butanediol dehydrogenase / diacetyl reductase